MAQGMPLKFSKSKLTRALEKINRISEQSPGVDTTEKKSKHQLRSIQDDKVCIFCSQTSGTLHLCSTMRLDHELHKMAEELRDTSKMSKPVGGDLVAIDAKYHNSSLTAYKKRYRSLMRTKASLHGSKVEKPLLARAFTELVSYIESIVESGSYIFKLSVLHRLDEDRLSSLRIEKSINKTRLKKQLMEHFSLECQEQSDGKNCLLVFNEGLQKMLQDPINFCDFNSEAILTAKVVKIIRRDIFERESFKFCGSFPCNCQENFVSPTLKTFMSMLLNGTNVQDQGPTELQDCLSLYISILSVEAKVQGVTLKSRNPSSPLCWFEHS